MLAWKISVNPIYIFAYNDGVILLLSYTEALVIITFFPEINYCNMDHRRNNGILHIESVPVLI